MIRLTPRAGQGDFRPRALDRIACALGRHQLHPVVRTWLVAPWGATWYCLCLRCGDVVLRVP